MPFYMIILTTSVNFILNNFIVFVMFYSCETLCCIYIKKYTNDGGTRQYNEGKTVGVPNCFLLALSRLYDFLV